MKKYKTITYRKPNFILFDLAFLAILAIGFYRFAMPEITYHLEMINRALEVLK